MKENLNVVKLKITHDITKIDSLMLVHKIGEIYGVKYVEER